MILSIKQTSTRKKKHIFYFNVSIYLTLPLKNVLPSLQNVPICAKLGSLFNESKASVSVDWENETEKRDKEIQELKKNSFKPNQTKGEFKADKKMKKINLVPFVLDRIGAFKHMLSNRSIDPNTSLHYASMYGCLDIVKLLIEEYKVDPNIKNTFRFNSFNIN